MSDSATPWMAAHQASLSFTVSWSLLKFTSIESVMLSNYLILCLRLFLYPQSFPASGSFAMSWLFASGTHYQTFPFHLLLHSRSLSPFLPPHVLPRASLVAQLVKNTLAMQETWVRSLGWEDPPEKGKATHSSILA